MNAHPRMLQFFDVSHYLTHLPRHRIPFFIILLAILIRIPMILIPQYSGFQHTTWRQTDTASIAHNFVDNGYNLFYPQVHWGGNGPGYVETEFQLYPFATALLYGVFGEQIWLGLLVSLIFSIGTLWVFHALAQSLLPYSAAVIALIFFAFSPLYLRFSVAFMPEPVVLFFYITGLYLFYQWLRRPQSALWVLAAVSTAMAILIKPTSIHIGLIFSLMLFEKYHFRLLTKIQVWLTAIISLTPGILWYLHARNLYLIYGNTFGIISGGDSKFDNLRYWFTPSFYSSLAMIDLEWVLAFGGLIPFAVGFFLICIRRQPSMVIFGILSQLVYYLLIPRYTSFAIYYHIYMLPFAALCVGSGLLWLLQNGRKTVAVGQYKWSWSQITAIAAVVVMSAFMLRSYRTNIRIYEQPLWDCSQFVNRLVAENIPIIVSTTSVARDQGIENNYQEPNVFYYSHRYGWSLPADQHTVQQVTDYRSQGAQYLIFVDHQPLYDSPELERYLRTNAQQIGPGVKDACSIYQFVG